MKALELTKEHKCKLLKMCKVLFPELTTLDIYHKKDTDINLDTFFIDWAVDKYINKGKDNEEYLNKEYSIHWFEFCMTHLANKIYYPDLNNIARGARNKIQSFFFSTFMEAIEGGTAGYDHPIDHLYSDFKKITVKQSKERFCHECNSWGNGCGQCV